MPKLHLIMRKKNQTHEILKIRKDKEGIRNCQRLKAIKGTQQPKIMWDPGPDPEI